MAETPLIADARVHARSMKGADRTGPLLLMLGSGFAGLGYQLVWTQQAGQWLGHELVSMLAVVAGFFGGLAFGAFSLGSRIEHSHRPRTWYICAEVTIGLWALLLAHAPSAIGDRMFALLGPTPTPLWHWTAAFGGTFITLLPATAAMGVTLPALERACASAARGPRSVARLYAANTLGAVVGVLASAFLLLPELGLSLTATLCALVNLGCAFGALMTLPRGMSSTSLAMKATTPTPATMAPKWGPLMCLAATGLLGIGYEVVVVRVLSQVTEKTVYTFALLLAVYLIGSACGAAAWRHREGSDGRHVQDRLLAALSMCCLVGAACLWGASHAQDALSGRLGVDMGAALAGEATLALLAFAPATAVMGALFSHQCALAHRAGANFGVAIGVNTLGAALAPVLFGLLVYPRLGPKYALLLIVLGYLALLSRHAWQRPAPWLALATSAGTAVLAAPLAFIEIPAGGHVVSYAEGTMAAVSVVEDADGVARLRIDNRQQEGSNVSLHVDARQALLPILLHAHPRHALFLGLGTGVTATAATLDTDLSVDAVELVPEVISASRYFTRALADEAQGSHLRVFGADARRYVRAATQRYDVVVADNFHPARSGAGVLYTVEHFGAVRGRLAEGGLFCQWLPLHQLDLATLRSIVQSFIEVFPHATALIANNGLQTPVIGLIGRAGPSGIEVDTLEHRLQEFAMKRPLADFGVEDTLALLGSFIAGPTALARFAGGMPANTDDRPVVTYAAPRITYATTSSPADRLVALLGELTVTPEDVLSGQRNATFERRLTAYWQARTRFIEAGRAVEPSADVQAMLAQVREPLLAVLRISPDFRPAYDPLVHMASALAASDEDAARSLLMDLASLQPSRAEAPTLLRELETRAK